MSYFFLLNLDSQIYRRTGCCYAGHMIIGYQIERGGAILDGAELLC